MLLGSRDQRHDPFQWSSFINDLLYASHHPWTPAAESACEEARSHVAVSRVEAGPADKTSRDFERPDPSCAALPQRPEGSSPLYGVPHGLPRRPELLGGEFPRLPGGPVPGNRESPQTQWRPQSGDAEHKKCASVKRCSNVQCNADGGRAENPTFAGKRGSHSRSASGLAAPPSGPSLGPQRPRGPSMAPWRIDGSVPLSQDPMGPKDALPSGNPSPCPDPHQAGAPTGPNRSPALGPPAPSLPQPGVGSPLQRSPTSLDAGPLRIAAQQARPPARAQGLPLPSGSPTVPSDEGPPDSGVATSLGRAQPAACLPLPAGRPQACSTARQIGPSLVNGPSQGGSPPQPGRVSGLSRGRKRPRDGSCGLSQGASPAGGKAMRQATLSFGKNLEGKSSGAKDIGWKGVSRKEGKVEQEGSLLASTGPRMKIGVAGAGERPASWLASICCMCCICTCCIHCICCKHATSTGQQLRR